MDWSWWNSLSALNRWFYVAAVFFSTIFVWQLVASFTALGGGEGADADGTDAGVDLDPDADLDDLHPGSNLVEDASGISTFRLLSVRSILAFGMLFSWAGALYLSQDHGAAAAMGRAIVWGLTGMVIVASFFWLLPRLTEEGNADVRSAVGSVGLVYIDIPSGGLGQVRVLVNGVVSFVRARSADGGALPAGTVVRVKLKSGDGILEVEKELESESA
ncbi:MAG: hypothetical protein GXY76_15005 [Chloroflexi bacterium]|nr:hypothetical protein [Chloroflexota bacterium]